jgi:carboxylesterase type B
MRGCGFLGFFSLQNEDVPGNAGLYDTVNALQWVKNNIKHFGGNPDAITIAGQSAGAVMVTQMMVSPLAQGLFQRAIAASGSALNAYVSVISSSNF